MWGMRLAPFLRMAENEECDNDAGLWLMIDALHAQKWALSA